MPERLGVRLLGGWRPGLELADAAGRVGRLLGRPRTGPAEGSGNGGPCCRGLWGTFVAPDWRGAEDVGIQLAEAGQRSSYWRKSHAFPGICQAGVRLRRRGSVGAHGTAAVLARLYR